MWVLVHFVRLRSWLEIHILVGRAWETHLEWIDNEQIESEWAYSTVDVGRLIEGEDESGFQATPGLRSSH
jgi:hypothetical protein